MENKISKAGMNIDMGRAFLIIMIILLLSTGVLADDYKDKYVQLLDQENMRNYISIFKTGRNRST